MTHFKEQNTPLTDDQLGAITGGAGGSGAPGGGGPGWPVHTGRYGPSRCYCCGLQAGPVAGGGGGW